jgi:hypothetical protein
MSLHRRIFVFDLDGVIANCDGREAFDSEDHPSFYSHFENDVPFDATRNLIRSINRSWAEVVILTCRRECLRTKTVNWLLSEGIEYERLFMQPDDDETPSPEFKTRTIQAQIRAGYQILGVFEDNPGTVRMLREVLGVPVLAICSGRYHSSKDSF